MRNFTLFTLEFKFSHRVLSQKCMLSLYIKENFFCHTATRVYSFTKEDIMFCKWAMVHAKKITDGNWHSGRKGVDAKFMWDQLGYRIFQSFCIKNPSDIILYAHYKNHNI